MKKNGYLRSFLALFLAFVMIMADSSVTTFAATVGRVKQKSAAAESSSQCNVQINVAEELDVEQFLNDYKYIMLGTETPDKWPGIGATSSIEKISTTENVVLNDVAEGTEKKIYFVQGKESWQWGAYKTTGDTFQQGENKFKISVSETASGLTVNINKVEFISRNVQIVADADLDFAAFTNQYKYVMLGKTTSSGVEAVSTIEQIDSNTTDVELKVDKDENADDLKLYFIRDTYNLNSNLTNDSKFKQGNVNYKIAVTTDNNNFNVNIEKVVFQPGPTVDYKSVLGNSLHFGIVANDFTCNGDLEANLAVGTLHGSGNMKSSKNYGGNGTTLIGAYVDYGWYIFKNSEGGQGDLILYTTPDAANRFGNDIWSKGLVIDTETYSQEEIQNIVRSMVDESRMTSNKLASDAHTKGLKYSSVADENGVIDLTTSPAGTYYIDFEIGEYANSNLNLKITGDQNIVLNIPDETATLKTYQLNIDGKNCNIGGYANGGIGEKACENIIFNLNNASSVISETIHGVVLVPNGSFENKAVGAGWIVADSVTSGGTEWHCLSRDIPVVTSYAIKAKKTVNGKAPSGNEAGKFTFKLYKIDDKGNETLVDTKSNGDGGLVSFDTFGNITEAGTYWYKITEEGTVAGYTIDTTVYYAEVVVNATPSNGVIISKNAKVTYHKGTKTGDTATVATFNNIKKEDETSANIKVKKTFTNGAADKKFNFVLTPINNAPMPEGAVNGKKTISVAQNDGVKNFGEIKYTTAGTYRYEVVEDSSEQAAGITYDNHRWTVTVAVPADFSTPTVTYSREDGITSTIGAEFTNSEENKETEITLEGTKSLSGRNLKAGEFKFEVKDEVGTVVATGTNDAAGKIAFSRIGYKLSDLKKGDGSYASEKTYSYKVSEVKGNAGDGITYDDKEYTVKVKVSYDQASGTMKAELADKDQKLAFANSYDTETGIDLEGTKSLEGRTLKDKEFKFEVKDEVGTVVATGTNDAAGKIAFSRIGYKLSDLKKGDGSYASEKTYSYKVSEVKGNAGDGITYDDKEYTVKVKVSYDQANGTMKAELADKDQKLAFANSYDTETGIDLEGTKSLEGRTLKDGEFTFEVKDKAGKVVATGSNKSDGSISFNNKLNYKLSDLEKADGSYESEKTYEYTVNEVIPEGATAENNYTVNGVTYDSKTVNVKVTVTYNKETGELKAELAKDSEAIAFQNSYETKTSIGLEGTKSLSGRTLKDSEFTFEVKDKAGKVVATGSNKSDGSISFNNKLNYKLSDLEKADGSYESEKTYEYTVNEVIPEGATAENNYTVNGVTYDSKTVNVKVTVTYNKETGELKAELAKDSEAIAFQNSYETKTSIGLEGTKSLSGRTLKDSEFTFEVKDKAGKVVATGSNKSDGSISFNNKLNYKLSDLEKADGSYESEKTYEYTVNEVIPEGATAENNYTVNGVTYDSKTVNVKVTVTYNKETGELKAELAKDSEAIAFQNSYETKTSIGLEGTKSLSGRTLKDSEFTFEVKDKAGKVVATGSNKSDGSISFNNKLNYKLSDLEKADGSYESEKTYEYTVNEVIPEGATAENNYTVNGVTYDSKTVNVKVTVTYNKETGELKAELAKDSEAIAFQNSYETKTSIGLEGTKSLSGRTLKDSEFTFEVKDKAGKVVATGSNKSDGSISFNNKLNYKLSDLEKADGSYESEKTYEYTVNEVIPEGATAENNYTVNGVTYDSKTVNVKVTVTYNKETGELKAELAKDSEAIAFQNSYDTETSIGLEGTKSLSGRTLKDGEFTFEVKDKAGKVVATGSNKSDGSISFNNKLNYKLSDLEKADGSYESEKTYEYTVNEVIPEGATAENNYTVNGVTYDSKTVNVKVTVTYNKETGELKAELAKDSEAIAFQNSYETKTSIGLEGTKSLSGRTLKDGEFTFEVKDKAGKVVATGSNKSDGSISFNNKLNYKLSDLEKADGSYESEKTYEYTVNEVIPEGATAENNYTVNGVTYDSKTVNVKVTVTYNKETGELKAELAKDSEAIAFQNSYDTETSIGLEGTKSLSGRTLKDGEFTFEVKDKAGKVVATGSNKSDGSISFNNKLNYKLSDLEKADGSYESEKTYEYTVNEVIPEGATAENNYTVNGVTYDNSIFTVKVIVSYDQATGIMSAAFAEDSQELIFDNTYDAKGSLTLEASKTLKNKALEADAFNFVLKDKNGETIQTVANDADGNVTFSPLNYTLKDVGTHVYTVSEVQRENTEVTYDTTEYTVEVTVADAGNGKLKVSKTIKKGDYTVDAIAFENIYKGVIDISGSKTWNDADNQDGIRPASITVKLFANGTEAASQVVTPDEAGNWNYVFKNLPQYDAKGKITYTVTESAVAGYETSVSGYNITNTHKPATLDITGTKTWNDSNNQDGKRPKSITVNLLANGIITDTKTVTADDNWTYSFTDLPKYANGQEITYTVSELTVPGYTTTIDDNYNITNSYTPGETSASVTKIWDDADNQDGIRPESITVALLANGTPTNKTVTLTAANNWTQTITGLPEKADGEYITYTWTEVNVPEGYSLTGTSKNETVTTLTNTHTPELTSITGTKTWKDADNQDGKRPESITVNLFADGTKLKSQSVSADADGNWTYSFTDLPKYANGQEITYTVTEDAVDGYTTESDGYNFINTHQPETTEITVTKTWNDANNQDGKRPESITVILLANGTEKTRQAVTADEAGNWTYTFKDLPKYANGQEITYTVAEEEVTDYTTTYDGSNITNSYTPGKTSATVTKIWNDAENQDGKRPESITVSLLADGKETGKTVTLSVENNWKQTISDLPEKADGKAIEYTWTEETLPEGYELTDNSKNGTVTTLTNTYAPETTSITGTKTWDDADNQDGKRPESIVVNLLANGEIVARQTVKADEAGNWTYTFKDLPKYANGKEITYTVTEEAVEGYETSVDGFNITNTYTTETTEVKGSKTWNDADNQDGKRPESITVRLLANGEEKDSQTVTADENGNWTYSFEKLPKYEAGKEIVYTVTEDAVADYTTEITGYDITNSYAPGKTSVTVTKAWADNDDRGGHRPKEIKVQLKADGENSGEEITLNAENNWTYTWSDLDQKKAGKDIAYTVEETGKAAGYTSTVTGNAEEGFIITNTITSVKISKVDITDQKELAGAHIQVIDKDGNVVEEWDSTWEAHEVTGLKPGETYTLRETVAPEGYTLTSDTTFTLKEDGTVNKDTTTTTISDNGTLLVEDSRTSVKVSKVDISDGKELEGAHIQIIDQDGNVVDEWDSTKEAHVTEKLKTGKIYTLRETVAPDGYLLTSDTTFVLKEDGTVDAEKTTAVSKDGVLLVQDKLATAASIAVTKKLTYIGENLAARDQTFYVALYSDKDCTQRVSDVKALVFKNADASTVVFSENIKAGKTYYIAECTQDGTSQTIGALADGTVYEAVFGNGNSTTVTEANGTTTVSFENVFSSFPPDGFYKQGQLTITKKVLGADGGTRNSNEVFYAGIFDDAAHTQLSQQVEQNIIKLDMDGGYEVSEIINVGLAQSGAKVTLYVTETDSNGKPIAGSEGFGYKVTVSADSVIFDETNMTAEVVITNQEESTVTETPTPTPSSDGGNSGGSENHSGGYGGGKSPKTGDDTPIGTYLMLLLAAAMLAAETERRRRRNKRQ